MKNMLNFNELDVAYTLSALESFKENPKASVNGIGINEPLKTQLTESAVKKLENLSVFTNFNGKELSLMALALQYVIEMASSADTEFNVEALYSAETKILNVAN